MSEPTLHALVTEVTVSLLPPDHMERSIWSVTVAWRGGDRYAVTHLGSVLNRDQQWEHEPIPSSRDDAFIARARFDYHEAYRLACEQAPLITVNGYTAADVLARAGGEQP